MKTQRDLDEECRFICSELAQWLKNSTAYPPQKVRELLEHYDKWNKEVEYFEMEKRRKYQMKMQKRIKQLNYTNR